MGYSTQYRLLIFDRDGQEIDWDMKEEVIGDLRLGNDNARYALLPDGDTAEECKWYDAVEDLEKFSTKYPGATFVLYGNGEESPDIWRAFIRNGESEKQEIVFSFPDPPTRFGVPEHYSGKTRVW